MAGTTLTLESPVRYRERAAATCFFHRAMKQYGSPNNNQADWLRSVTSDGRETDIGLRLIDAEWLVDG